MFAGLAIGASRAGDPVWVLASAALALQTARHAIDFSYPGVQQQVIALAPQPPLEAPLDGPRAACRRAASGARGAGRGPHAAAAAALRRVLALWRAGDRYPPRRVAEEDHRIPDRRAVRRDLGHRRAVLTRARRSSSCSCGAASRMATCSRAGRCGRSPHERGDRHHGLRRHGRRACSRATATTARSPARSAPRAGRARRGCPRSRCCSSPALPGLVAIVADRGRTLGAGWSLGAVAWAVLVGGLSSGRPLDRPAALGRPARAACDRVRRPALDRRGRGRVVAARRLRAAVRGHLPPLRRRLRSAPPRRAARRAGCRPLGGGWDGRLLARLRAAARRRAAGRLLRRGRRDPGLLFVGETIAEWRGIARAQPSAEPAGLGDDEDEGGGRLIGMVLAAGAGRRLESLTQDLPKTLLPVDGERTILDIALGNLRRAGLETVVVVTGYAAERVSERQAALEERHDVQLELVFNPKAEEWNNAYSLWCAREHFARGRAAVQRRHGPPARGRGAAAGRPRRRRARARARRREAARRRRR